MIRWTRLALLLFPLLLLWAATHFFLDRGLRWTLETVGTSINGARVDVGGVSTHFWNLSATVSNVQITDAENPMRNLVHVDALRLAFEMKPLFWKKFIVRDAALLGIQTDTPRRVSGALPVSATDHEQKSGLKSHVQKNLKQQYDPDELITLDSLASYKKIKEEQARWAARPDEWRTRLDGLDPKPLASRVASFTERVQTARFSGLEGVKAAADLLSEGKTLKNDLEAAKKKMAETKTALATQLSEGKKGLADIERLKREDIDRRLALVRGAFSADGVLRALLGDALISKIRSTITLAEKIRARVAPTSQEPPAPPSPGRRGQTIPFPLRHNWPVFHLKSARLSGKTSGERPLAYAGTLTDVSSDPVRLGLPITLTVQGKDGDRSLNAEVTAHFAGEASKQTLSFRYEGIPLSGTRLGEWEGPATLTTGRGRVESVIQLAGGRLSGEARLKGTDLKIAWADAAPQQDWAAAVKKAIGTVNEADVKISISGAAQDPAFAVTSSLDNVLATALKKGAAEEFARHKAQATERLNTLLAGETAQLSETITTESKKLLDKAGPLGDQLGALEKPLNDVLASLAQKANPASGAPLPNLKNIFKR